MRKGRPKYPQPRDVAPVMDALRRYIPTDAPVAYGMRESLSHIPNFRIKAQTSEVGWTVDIYKGGFYHAQVGEQSERFTSIQPLLAFLLRWLKR